MTFIVNPYLFGAAAPWTPAQLFASSEKGVWYDPSDLSTLFQDSAGTTPVTAVEQPVGRILDKSGNAFHATQATSAARPVYRSRYNFLTYSEQFDNAAWTKSNLTITANNTTAPDGTTTADKFTATANDNATIQNISFSGIPITYSVYAKKIDTDWIAFSHGASFAWFDIGTGATGTIQSGTATITNVGSGWYRCTWTPTNYTSNTVIRYRVAGTNGSIAGNGLSAYFWGAQIMTVSDATETGGAYQRIVDSATYDTTGFLPYLDFDGTDDCLFTASIDFSGTNKLTAWYGAYKRADGGVTRTLAELTASAETNNGGFALIAPIGGANYAFITRGTTTANYRYVQTYAAPIRNVVSVQLDNSAASAADQIIAKVDGASVSGIQYTGGATSNGNYANAALYVGRRNNASNSLNGRIYGLIVRGASSTSTEISNAETWINGKTGAY